MEKQTKKEEQQTIVNGEEETAKKKTPEAETNTAPKKKKKLFYQGDMPEQIHCRRCKTLMENGVCPSCGFRMYMPMDPKKQQKIRLIATLVGFAVFLALFLWLNAKG